MRNFNSLECPSLPDEVETLRKNLTARHGKRVELEMWTYVKWYDARFGISDLQSVWVMAVNRVAERYRMFEHRTGAKRPRNPFNRN